MFSLYSEFEATVNELCFDEGDAVKEGDIIMALTCMKMMFPLQAPGDGVVHYKVAQEDYVIEGQLLAEVE